jgi:hypothetical protein
MQMADGAANSIRTLDCAGFRIEESQDELRVIRDGSPSTARGQLSISAHIMHALALVFVLTRIFKAAGSLYAYADSLESLPELITSQMSLGSRLERSFQILLPIFLMGFFYAWYFWVLRKGDIGLHCTREKFELLNIFRGQVRSVQSFAKVDVKQIQFGGTTFSTVPGIVYSIAGKKTQIFKGIKCVEAKEILDQLDRLGYDVLHDVAMPMMVEMENERRKSWLA